MSVALKQPPMSLEEFHAFEAEQDERWEMFGPFVKAMVGAPALHGRVVGNLFLAVASRLRAKRSRCEAFSETFRVVTPAGDSVYPDLVVVCDRPDPGAVQTRTPTVLAEVYSKSSFSFDRGPKRDRYLTIPGLTAYLRLDPDARTVEIDHLMPATDAELLTRPDQSVKLPALGIEIPLAEIFDTA